jgi:hypothetical protein
LGRAPRRWFADGGASGARAPHVEPLLQLIEAARGAAIDYANCNDHGAIIERRENWNTVFEPMFGRVEDVRKSLGRESQIRSGRLATARGGEVVLHRSPCRSALALQTRALPYPCRSGAVFSVTDAGEMRADARPAANLTASRVGDGARR